MNSSKLTYLSVLFGASAIGSWFVGLLGGWTTSLETLLIFMTMDYLTGLLCALVWHKSPKSSDGTFESKSSLKGLFRKGGILLFVLIAARLDLELSTSDHIRTAVILFFIVNEGLSIIENWGIMGLPLPNIVRDAFSAMKKSASDDS